MFIVYPLGLHPIEVHVRAAHTVEVSASHIRWTLAHTQLEVCTTCKLKVGDVMALKPVIEGSIHNGVLHVYVPRVGGNH